MKRSIDRLRETGHRVVDNEPPFAVTWLLTEVDRLDAKIERVDLRKPAHEEPPSSGPEQVCEYCPPAPTLYPPDDTPTGERCPLPATWVCARHGFRCGPHQCCPGARARGELADAARMADDLHAAETLHSLSQKLDEETEAKKRAQDERDAERKERERLGGAIDGFQARTYLAEKERETLRAELAEVRRLAEIPFGEPTAPAIGRLWRERESDRDVKQMYFVTIESIHDLVGASPNEGTIDAVKRWGRPRPEVSAERLAAFRVMLEDTLKKIAEQP